MADENTRIDSLRWYLTGASSDGGTQTNPDASLGNYRSSTELEWLEVSRASAISGIDLDYIHPANGEGAGTLTATGTSELKWTPPGGSQGAGVTIANGETKLIEGGGNAPEKAVRVTRTSATALSGTETDTLVRTMNGLFDNVSAAEAASGDTEYRALMLRNTGSTSITNLKVWIGTLGAQADTDSTQLSSSGAGTITTTGSFSDWPNSGFAHIRDNTGTTREIVYYTSRTNTALTVPSAGRALLGTSAGAGAATDTVDAVPGIRIAKEAPTASALTDKTSAGEGSQPAGLTWSTAITSTNGVSIGTLAAGALYGLWIERVVPVGATSEAVVRSMALNWSFDAA